MFPKLSQIQPKDLNVLFRLILEIPDAIDNSDIVESCKEGNKYSLLSHTQPTHDVQRSYYDVILTSMQRRFDFVLFVFVLI